MKVRKAAGPDGIHPGLLRHCADQLCEIVQVIFNLSLKQERVPVLWKTSCVVPIPKTAHPTDLNGYRPVALTSHLMKAMERLVLDYLRPLVKPVMDPLQFAYQPGIGVDDAIIYLLQRSLSHLDRAGSTVRIMFFDLSSAFNTIRPSLLRDKMETAGVDRQLTTWTMDYLTNRPQFVRLKDCVSDTILCSTGAPQGTVLAPFLFTLYTADFSYNTATCHLQKFSDDSAVVGYILDGEESKYRELTKNFVDWCGQNHLVINTSKTKELVVDFRRSKAHPPKQLSIQGRNIETVNSYRYLGVHLNNKLDWSDNTQALYKKGRREMDSYLTLILLMSTVTLITARSVRIVDGGSRCAGRVEVLHRGQWGTVCDDDWNMKNAAVVCRDLDCGEAVDVLGGSHFGPGSGPIWLNGRFCTGSESTWEKCGAPKFWKSRECSHDNNAGMICSGKPLRLVGGSRCSGRVEVLHGTSWATVCDADFDQQDAEVVCRELGCGLPVEVLGAAAFGRGEGQVWTEELQCRGNESDIYSCSTSSLKHSCFHDNDVGLLCADSVRLVGGISRCAGRVEVLHRGQWGTVCDDNWDMRDAAVVCRELDCGEAVDVLDDSHFGPGSGPIWMDDVDCSGSESTLKNCRSAGWGKHNCNQTKTAGVICSAHQCVRLVGGSRCSGKVEVHHGKTWSAVCDADFDQQDAEVVCRELGCGLPLEVLGAVAFGRGEGQMWTEELQCRGTESEISLCPTSSVKHNCFHDSSVGLVCGGTICIFHIQYYSVRLVGGINPCAGRVEVLHRGQWGTVCDDNWDMRDAAVVCRELDCGEAVDVLGDSHFGPGSGQIWMDDVDCSGSESTLKNCRSAGWGKHNCNQTKNAGVICSVNILGVRLVGGPRCSGRVEVHHGKTWSTVCDADFDQQDAEVVCRELGCGLPVEVLGAAAFGRGEGQVWTEELQCRGNESDIYSCPTSSTLKHDCSHDNDVGLVCADSVRLVGGISPCAGRVEVLHRGQWGTVCDDNWDMRDAAVVCKDLGCGEAVDVLGGSHFGPGSGPIWMDDVDCSGSESTLKNCGSSRFGVSDCHHGKDAGVICSGVRLVGGSHCSGRVEVLHGTSWATVCDADFDQQDAEVVCRELGCGLPVEVLGEAAFGRGEGEMWTEELQCRGNESDIYSCPTSSTLKHNCSHDNDVSLLCADSVRLIGGINPCAGRVEVLHKGQWGTVCVLAGNLITAVVLCRELDCGEPVELSLAEPGSGPIWMSHVDCSGSESTLKNCRSLGWGEHNCGHNEDLKLICSGHKMSRLTDGPHLCTGRVEVLLGTSWSTVCDADFDQQDAEVVCRELGCGLPVEVLGAAAFGRGEGQVWTKELQCRGNESEISLCPTSSVKQNCSHYHEVGLICSGHTAARLVSGWDSCSGRVELQYLSDWGSVCGGSWNMRAASVLCGQLKCGSAVAVLGADWFGEGRGHIWADVFDCHGNETHLSECPISSWNRAACSHEQDVGVICNGSTVAFHEGRLRLSGGRECEGQVEVFFIQDWRRVLLDSWSVSEASVVCRQLGCGSVLNFSSSSPSSPEQHSHMCVTGFNCSGSEAHLGNCSSAKLLNFSCSSKEQLYITCSGVYNSAHSSIRLVGSGGDCAGRLEVFLSGSWGTVCDDSWDIEDAQVVCRQLQCGVALSVPVPAWFGPGTGPIQLNEVQCEGSETSLWNCSYQSGGEHDCRHKEDVGVVCSEFKEIRLTEGCEGNLEVFYNGTWGNVCVNGMNEETVSLVCRELNCGRTGRESVARARVESAPNWLDQVKCRKHDSTLWHCPSEPWGQNNCDNYNEVAHITCSGGSNDGVQQRHVRCSSSPSQSQCSNLLPLRLRGAEGSCSGRLEVYHNTVWGSVCGDQWDIRDAEVVCRQLGCGKAMRADGGAASGAGEGVMWLNRVKCRGDEIRLWNCSYSLKKHTDCFHKEDAGVTCADPSMFLSTPLTPTTSTSTITVHQTPVSSPTVRPVDLSALLVQLVLAVLLFLALVLLAGLVYQNRVLRRVISKMRRESLSEAVYEEIDHRYVTKRISTRRGSVLSEVQHSGYEDVEEELLSESSVIVDRAEYYDGVTTREDTPENYDDVITAGHNPDTVADDVSENYDDVITADQNSVDVTVDTPEDSDDVISAGQDVGGVDDYEDIKEEPEKEMNHVTERPRPMPFFRKLHLNFFKLKK
ncbi:antigen WC1.1-like [Brachyhypopomus gauderio]|uniref:antigen WC1.1-like n=1 Tax=Brachyhypopomus gauderio TaxID=698409 RepID=UPI0040417BE8